MEHLTIDTDIHVGVYYKNTYTSLTIISLLVFITADKCAIVSCLVMIRNSPWNIPFNICLPARIPYLTVIYSTAAHETG